jgi:hypothetical protein
MGLALRFISASAGMVTFVMGVLVEAEDELAGNFVMLNVVSSAAPFAQDATRTRRVYAGGWGWGQWRRCIFGDTGLRNGIESACSILPSLKNLKCEVETNAQVRD